MSYLIDWIDHFDGLMKTISGLALLFFSLTILLLGSIVLSKIKRKRRDSIKEKNREVIREHLAIISIYSSTEEELVKAYEESKKTIAKAIGKSKILKEWVLEEIVKQHANVTGEAKIALQRLYHELGLKAYSLKRLKSLRWSQVAKGISELERMNQVDTYTLFFKYLSARHKDLRTVARLAIASLAPNPLSFLDKVGEEISEWERMELDLRLRGRRKDQLPDFSKYYSHSHLSVVWFCVEMSVRFNYYEHIPHLIKLLNRAEGSLKSHAVNALTRLEAHQAIGSVRSLLTPDQEEDVLISSLKFMAEVGDESCHSAIMQCMDHPRTSVRMQAVHAAVKLDMEIKQMSEDIARIINHYQNELIV